MERSQWIDRKFSFDAPVGWMQNVLERLRGTEARLRDLSHGVTDAQASAADGVSWSLKEHIGHLEDLEELHIGRIDDLKAGMDTLRAADMSNAKTRAASHNTRSLEDLIAGFARMRGDLIARLEALDDATQLSSAMHPRLLVRMRPIDVAIFTADHDDHHLASMRQLLKKNSTPRKS